MVYSKSWQLSPLEICAVALFSFGLPKGPVYYAKCLPLPGKSEMLGKRKPQVPFGLVIKQERIGRRRGKATWKWSVVPMWRTGCLTATKDPASLQSLFSFADKLTKDREKEYREVTPVARRCSKAIDALWPCSTCAWGLDTPPQTHWNALVSAKCCFFAPYLLSISHLQLWYRLPAGWLHSDDVLCVWGSSVQTLKPCIH